MAATDTLAPAPPVPGAAARPARSEREFAFRDEDFAFLARLVTERSGIMLPDHKRHLVYGRLARRLRALGLRTFAEYCDLVSGPGGAQELIALVNAITTNLTNFFREQHHFDHLARVAVPEWVGRGDGRRLRLWSAGCSSGEEPYSMAMAVHGALPEPGRWDLRILATDLATDKVAAGRAGVYPAAALERIPAAYRNRYVRLRDDHGEAQAVMSDDLRALVTFKALNLLGPWPMRGPFDAIFCRNVVIYFDKPTQRALFDRLADLMRPGAYLYVGHSETLFNVTDRFTLVGRTIYRRGDRG